MLRIASSNKQFNRCLVIANEDLLKTQNPFQNHAIERRKLDLKQMDGNVTMPLMPP